MRRLVAALAIAVAAVVAGCGGTTTAGDGAPTPATDADDPAATAAPSGAAALPAGRTATVARVVDGDTIEVDDGERVRLIGIDTPETKDPRTVVECFGREASAATAELLPVGTAVVLVADVEPTDRYGRTLAYVHRAQDALFVNLALVERGYAQVATYPPNVAHVDELVAAQADARDAGRGLWSACGGLDGGSDGPAATPTTTGPGGCHPAYPTLCLPAAPDLDCADLDARRFPVLPPDPHGLDGNGDGIGCEG